MPLRPQQQNISRNKFLAAIGLLLCLSGGTKAFAQDKAYARQIIDTLTAPVFSGRGYVCDGAKRASQFISDQFKAAGLQSFTGIKGYIQPFPMSVNVFPGKMEVQLDGKTLAPGADYQVDAGSAGVKRKSFQILEGSALLADKDHHLKFDPAKTAIVTSQGQLDTLKKLAQTDPYLQSQLYSLREAVLILQEAKLIWTVYAHEEKPQQVVLEVKRGVIPDTAKTITLDIDQKFIPHFQSQNVAGYVKGKTYPDSFIFFTAHYDHLGRMGCDTYFPGANDNASGTAMLLDLVRYYSRPENQPEYSIGFIAFGGEEAGLLGSHYFTEHPALPLKNIAFLINMDLMANGQDGAMIVNGSVFPGRYDALVKLNEEHHYLKEIKKRGKAANSDHYWFTEKGVPAFFIYLLGDYPHYHDIFDTKEKPTMAGYEGTFRLLTDFVKSFPAK